MKALNKGDLNNSGPSILICSLNEQFNKLLSRYLCTPNHHIFHGFYTQCFEDSIVSLPSSGWFSLNKIRKIVSIHPKLSKRLTGSTEISASASNSDTTCPSAYSGSLWRSFKLSSITWGDTLESDVVALPSLSSVLWQGSALLTTVCSDVDWQSSPMSQSHFSSEERALCLTPELINDVILSLKKIICDKKKNEEWHRWLSLLGNYPESDKLKEALSPATLRSRSSTSLHSSDNLFVL